MAFTTDFTEFSFANDPIVIRSTIDTIKGGVALDTTGFTDEYVKAGHVIIADDATGSVFKPMPVTNGAYDTLPIGYHYAGVLISTIKTDEPLAAVLTIGEVNEKALPYPIDTIKTAFKAAVPTINWAHD